MLDNNLTYFVILIYTIKEEYSRIPDELYSYMNSKGINNYRPPFYGATVAPHSKFGNELVGLTFDRFQDPGSLSLRGTFASPVYGIEGISDLHFTYDSRALGTNILDGTVYIKFKIKAGIDPGVKFDFSEVIPWYGAGGLGDQIHSSDNFSKIINSLDILESKTYNKLTGQWN